MKKFVDGGPAQQVTQFQPTFSPAQQGIGSLQPYQAPNVPAMESSPTDYNQSSQYAPTQQYGAPATSYSTPAANPMTAGLGSYLQGLEYKAPVATSPVTSPVAPPVAPPVTSPISEPPSWASNPGTSYNPLVNYDNYGSPLGRKDEPNIPDARPTYNDEGQISNTLDYFQDDEGTVKSIYDEDGIRKYNDDGSRVNEDAPAERREDVLARLQKEKPVVNNPASPIRYDPVTQTYGETTPTTPTLSSPDTQTYSGTTPTPTLYNPATQSYSDNPAFTAPVAPVAEDSGSNTGYFYDDEGGRRSVYDEDGNRSYNDDGSRLSGDGEKAGGPIRAYARGGSTPQGIASLGRGKDTMLVHMTPGEVHGLQQLAMRHGGSLTINPQTGLPEAGFLSSLLPMIGAGIGIALAPATGGASLYALGGGALGGMLGSKMEGKNPLMGAIMGGISGYGMGGIGDSLAQAGAAEGLNASAEMAFRAPQIDKAMDFYNNLPTEQLTALKDAGGISSADAYKTYLETTPNALAKMSPADLAKNLATPASQSAINANYQDNLMKGIRGLSSEQGRDAFIGTAASKGVPATGLGGGMGAAAKGIGLAAPLITQALSPTATALPANKPTQYFNTSYNPPKYNPATGAYEPGSYGPGSYYTDPTQYAAQGGTVGYARGGPADFYPLTGDRVIMNAAPGGLGGRGEKPDYSRDTYSDEGGINNNKVGRGVSSDDIGRGIHTNTPSGIKGLFTKTSAATLARYIASGRDAPRIAAAKDELNERLNKYTKDYGAEETTSAAQGGLMGTYAAGGKLLRGPGDGMSDSIPAVIQGANPQRAALADGEFVMPADVVSHLGNGSTEAGSKRLYAMMDRVRKARTGNPKQGRQINPNRFMPA